MTTYKSSKVTYKHFVTPHGEGQTERGVHDLLESEEERAGPDDEEQGQVEDSFLPGHHHPSVAAESVFPRELLPFSHLSCYHHRRHGVVLSVSFGLMSAVIL